jgi:hypothetical protein
MLYLGTTVLILFDLSYLSRFWTQFEAWLSMQFATPDGLKSAVGTKNARYHIVCIQGAAEQAELYKKALVDTWATKTPQQAFDFLSKPDVTVTNQSDKEGQLPKIRALDVTVQGAFQAVMNEEERRAAMVAAELRAKAEQRAKEAAAQAAAELRAKEEQRARASAQAAAALRAEEERRASREAPVKRFRGPCADCCKPLAPCCCVSADGEAIFGCVPTDRKYFLPACLHMALCPQLGCDPRGGAENFDCLTLCIVTLFSSLFVCCNQEISDSAPFWVKPW